MSDNIGESGPRCGAPSHCRVVGPFCICDTSGVDTSGVATDQTCTGPRLRLTSLIRYTPLCVIGASSTTTPVELLAVCRTAPEGAISTNCIGTATLGSAAIEMACVPAGNVILRSNSCPADTFASFMSVLPGCADGVPVRLALAGRQNPSI